jgi:hypothetical protein
VPVPPYVNIRKSDLEDPTLSNVNLVVRTHTDELNRLGGLNGPVEVINSIDVGKNSVSAGTFILGTAHILSGTGSPNGQTIAPPGSLYINQAGGSGKTLWVKETGTGNIGWVAK